MSEGSCGDFGVGSGAPGLDFEPHFGSLLGAKNRPKIGLKIGMIFALILGRFLEPKRDRDEAQVGQIGDQNGIGF